MSARPYSPWRWWVGSALLFVLMLLAAPWIYRALVDLGWIDPTRTTGGPPYAKVLRRLLLIPILVGMLGALRPWRDVTLAGIGLTGPRARPRVGLTAWALTALAILVLLAAHVGLGWLVIEVDDPTDRVVKRVFKTFGSGMLIGVFEELIFRAWLPVRLGLRFGPRVAAVASVVAYALLHAFNASRLKDPIEVSTQGALEALGVWLSALVDPAAFGPACLGLVLFGALLLALYRRTGTLWAPIGVHAAAVWVLFAYGGVTNRRDTPSWAGSKLLYDGPLGWLLLLLALVLVLRWPRRPAPAAGDGGGRDGA